ncbi:35943_t:CDS:2, partial [Gigaspora margarita]
ILATLNKISEETVVEKFITNYNRKTIPILTKNGAATLFPIGPSVQMLNEPSIIKFDTNTYKTNQQKSEFLKKDLSLKEHFYDTVRSLDTNAHKTNQQKYEFLKKEFVNSEKLNKNEREFLLN